MQPPHSPQANPGSIRAPGSTDHDGWLLLWKGYQAFYQVVIPDDVSQVTWSRLLNPAEPMHAALAFDDANRALGLVHWLTHRSTWTTHDSCYLQDLFVASEARGRGIGRRLIEHVYQQATVAGCARVYWLTHETNTTAMTLYDRMADRTGFVQYRRNLP